MPQVFFSYAREDWNPYLERFYGDLAQELGDRLGMSQEEAIFRDETNVKLGQNWHRRMTEALRTCRMFVYARTPRYFQSDYCGREWAMFRRRYTIAAAKQPDEIPKILAVLWVPPEDVDSNSRIVADVPREATENQYTHADFPADYTRVGLQTVLKQSGSGLGPTAYQGFMAAFSTDLVGAIRKSDLRPEENGPSIEMIEPAFPRRTLAPIIQQAGTEENHIFPRGPRHVKFFYIAAAPHDFTGAVDAATRATCECYGETGGPEWQPFRPPPDDIAKIVQTIAASTDSDITYYHQLFDPTLPERVEAAQSNNNIVMLLIDPWTLRVPKYEHVLKKFDKIDFYNYALLITWNRQDSETSRNIFELKKEVREIFRTKYALQAPHFYLESVESKEDLVKTVRRAIEEARTRVARLAATAMPVGAGPFTSPPVISATNFKQSEESAKAGQ